MASRAVRRQARLRRRRRRTAAVVALVVAGSAVAGAVLFTRPSSRLTAASSVGAAATTTTTSTTLAPTTTTTVDPGTLPQTMDKPTTADPQFQAGLSALWQAIVTDNPTAAMPFFFPLSAYVQVKSISNPASDWQSRLVAAYQSDVHSLHASLGSSAATAQLTGIDVPDAAEWIQPGVEYNKGSYWRVEGSQVHYAIGGQASSFHIASMISWRGHWYVVHLARIA